MTVGIFVFGSTRTVILSDSGLGTVMTSSSNAVPAATTWYALKVTRSGGTVRIFADGTQIASATYNPPTLATPIMDIGANPSAGQLWNGYMRDILIINGVATHTANYVPMRRPLVTY